MLSFDVIIFEAIIFVAKDAREGFTHSKRVLASKKR
jgi:hypothetical protein